MQRRFLSSSTKNLCRKIVQPSILTTKTSSYSSSSSRTPCDIFINHRGIDTKRTIAGLLHDHIFWLGFRPFLDSRNMKPGDNLFRKINPAIKNCKLGLAIFSPNYCDSNFCLHELALLMESKKRVIPIFCDVKPSQLQVTGTLPAKQLQRFSLALEKAKFTVGLTFDSSTGNWSDFLNTATDAILKNLVEVEAENSRKKRTYIIQGQDQNM